MNVSTNCHDNLLWCLKVNSYSLMDIPCTGIWPSPPQYQQLPVWHQLTWQPRRHLSQQPPAVQPQSLPIWGFAWEEILVFSVYSYYKMAAQSFFVKHLPGHNFSSSRSAGVNSQWVHFFSHGRANETIFECEHCNRIWLPAHTQNLKWGDTSRHKLSVIQLHS